MTPGELVRAFAGEWELGQIELALLWMEVNKLEHTIAARQDEEGT